jgi:hypothetical protein
MLHVCLCGMGNRVTLFYVVTILKIKRRLAAAAQNDYNAGL